MANKDELGKPNFNWRDYKDKIPNWIIYKIDKEAIQFTKDLGEHLANPDDPKNKNGMSSSQLRNLFGEIRRIQIEASSPSQLKENTTAINMLQPKLAYAVKRDMGKNKHKRTPVFQEVFDKAMGPVQDAEKSDDEIYSHRFQNFVMLIESIIAYHKFHGGKE
jgi:CRISPR-associated protein Csm2